MRVLKFGGTSVGDAVRIRRAAEVIGSRAGCPAVLVFSAMGDTTDRLEQAGKVASSGDLARALEAVAAIAVAHRAIADELVAGGRSRRALLGELSSAFRDLEAMARGMAALRDFSPSVQDRFLSYGELLSTRILAAFLRERGAPARWVDSRELIVTDGCFTRAEPLVKETAVRCRARLLPLLRRGLLPVVQGFVGRSVEGADTTLGRGGSDCTAALIGAALGAEEIEIWTDVDGIMTADPSLVPDARSIPVMSFQEAAELAFFGARVLHPKTLLPAVERGIPVRVLNTLRPGERGTLILGDSPASRGPVKSIAYKEGITVVNLVSARMFRAPGFLFRVFEVLRRHGLAPEVMATSEVSVALAFSQDAALPKAVKELEELGGVECRRGQVLVCAVGERLRRRPGVVGDVLRCAGRSGITLVSQGGSEISLAFVINERDLAPVVRRLHRRFFEGRGRLRGAGEEGMGPRVRADGGAHG
jgi:aspartate kinase